MVITSIILSVLALSLSIWMGKRNPVRSSGLTAGMLVLLMFTPLLLWLPKVHLNLDVHLPWGSAGAGNVVEGVAIGGAGWSLMYLLFWVYGVVCAVLFTRLLAHYLVARRWCSEAVVDVDEWRLELLGECAEQLGLARLPEVNFSDQVGSPVITGLLRPVLLLPTRASGWSDETLRMVMLHELGHVQRRDLWTSLAGQIACALHWFNPLVWILRKRLIHECEYACDAHVISRGAPARNYINALCDVAEFCLDRGEAAGENGGALGFSAALSMANEASLRNRVLNLLDEKPGVDRVSSMIVVSVLAISASAAMAINLVRPDVMPAEVSEHGGVIEILPAAREVELRLSADPFPGG